MGNGNCYYNVHEQMLNTNKETKHQNATRNIIINNNNEAANPTEKVSRFDKNN